MRRTGVGVYLLLTFGIAWGVWEALAGQGWSPGESQFITQVLYGAFAPAVAALAVRILVTKEYFGDAGLAPRIRQGWKHYLFAWLFPLPAALLVLVLAKYLGAAEVDLTFEAGLARLAEASGRSASALGESGFFPVIGSCLTAALPAVFILFGEEFGWRGYLQRRIFPGSPLAAAVVTGVVWSAWHLPLNLRGYNFPEYPVLGMAVFTVSLIFLSIIFGWLRRSSGSIWPVCLAHASCNAVGGSLVSLGVIQGFTPAAAFLGMLGWLPLGGLAAWVASTGRLGGADGDEPPATPEPDNRTAPVEPEA
ncbi:CPBP family intramembrane glutamic endopeptidase [Desulfohalovibrio reitneri]|uniref:CPBP family intramembrane glutamic endopeptidase n=1 Tax=Desulfohalovibrio reitneri TaxID=1307759 RepID=UPI0006925865|nr:CPBP family intramembrane glutamic endopeptidase [Desulfohalovibrio reitneri]